MLINTVRVFVCNNGDSYYIHDFFVYLPKNNDYAKIFIFPTHYSAYCPGCNRDYSRYQVEHWTLYYI